jgi:predicted DNA-binding transcriptional regulator AlpA
MFMKRKVSSSTRRTPSEMKPSNHGARMPMFRAIGTGTGYGPVRMIVSFDCGQFQQTAEPPRCVPAAGHDLQSPSSSSPGRNLSRAVEHTESQPASPSRYARRCVREGISLSGDGFLRLDEVLAVYPVSRAAWYAGVKRCIYPASVPLSRRSVGWSREAIRNLIANPPKF